MKSWKLIATLASVALLAGCGGEDSSSSDGANCSKAPKLTKACLEGTWNVNASLSTKLQSFFAMDSAVYANASLPAQGTLYPDGYLKLTFETTDATRKTPTAVDQVTFEVSDGSNAYYASGSYSLSADSTVILFNMDQAELLIVSNMPAKIFKDSTGTALSFGATSNPLFGNTINSGVKTAQIFYRAGATD